MRYPCPDHPDVPGHRPIAAMVSATVLAMALGGPALAANPCSPCAANKCAPAGLNPCAARNPCAAKNPCASKNPCAANPCAGKMNPCAIKSVKRPANYKPYQGAEKELRAYGERLYKDTKLSSNGLSCESCHQGGNLFQASFAKAYPHEVAMAKNQFGMSQVFLDEMVQICMVAPMATKALGWQSKELAALTAYVATLQTSFKPNPCAAKNPCAARNPYAAENPCVGKNPCAAKCAAGAVSK